MPIYTLSVSSPKPFTIGPSKDSVMGCYCAEQFVLCRVIVLYIEIVPLDSLSVFISAQPTVQPLSVLHSFTCVWTHHLSDGMSLLIIIIICLAYDSPILLKARWKCGT